MNLSTSKKLSIILGIVLVLFCFLCLCVVCIYSFLIPITRSTTIRNINNAETFSIKLERTACEGFCPVYSVSVDQDGNVVYNGEIYVSKKGLKQYKIEKDLAQKLYNDALDIDFFSLNDKYVNDKIVDLPSTIITITANGVTKSITVYGVSTEIPKKIMKLAEQIDFTCDTYQYVQNYNL